MVEYESRVLQFHRSAPRGEIRRALAAEAEYGQWELHRTRIYVGGVMRVWLRRKIIRAPRATSLAS